jgi:hypothetical protein
MKAQSSEWRNSILHFRNTSLCSLTGGLRLIPAGNAYSGHVEKGGQKEPDGVVNPIGALSHWHLQATPGHTASWKVRGEVIGLTGIQM